MSWQRNIRLLLADVDGTLVTDDKVLTNAAKAAAANEVRDAGIALATTRGTPRGMNMLIERCAATGRMPAGTARSNTAARLGCSAGRATFLHDLGR